MIHQARANMDRRSEGLRGLKKMLKIGAELPNIKGLSNMKELDKAK
jgi:hypothetical protein